MADKIQCSVHGEGWETYVCHHLKGNTFGLGFNREQPTPENLHPDAFCDECERIYREQGEWNETAKERIKIALLCSSCYESARIRNTRTAFKLEDLGGFRWKCGTCEEWHAGPCLDFGHNAPAYWSGEYMKTSSGWDWLRQLAGRTPKTFLDEDYCAINGRDFFVRGLIRLPILGTDKHFCWGVWGSLKRENFELLRRMDNSPDRVKLPSMFSWLSNHIAGYPDTMNLKMYAHIKEPGWRPLFELERTDHPLAREFYEGISPERVSEIMMNNLKEFGQKQ